MSTLTCPNGHRASMAGCHTRDCRFTILAPKREPRLTPGKPPGRIALKIVHTRQDGRLVAWDERGDVWILERHLP